MQEISDALEAVDYYEFHHKYNERDSTVREKMRELIDSDKNRVTNVFSTLVRYADDCMI